MGPTPSERPVLGLFWAAGSFRACFGLPEQLNPGPENIKSGLNRAVRPPYGLILCVRGATSPRMPPEALNAQKPFEERKKQKIHDFRLRPPWAWALGMPLSIRFGMHCCAAALRCGSAEGSLHLYLVLREDK